LDDIVKRKKLEIEIERDEISIEELIKNCSDSADRNFKKALTKKGISIIGELKKASPSKGIILEDFNLEEIAKIYEKTGVDAVSVLTETNFFKGDKSYIKRVKEVNSKPVLRKDFIIDKYQIYQSKVIGADAILLIVSILKNNLKEFYGLAKNLKLNCLVEVHDRQELEVALQCGCSIIGINNRNLKDFTVDIKNTGNLIKYIPNYITVVSESGIKTPGDIKYLESIGVDAVLIGETFMRNIKDWDSVDKFIAEVRE
jgi:indole-3-glycerol phosphate synthase